MKRTVTGIVVASLLVPVLGVVYVSMTSNTGPLKVSKETTYLLEPLDAEGYVDYVEAVNQRASLGVTPATNFEVVVRSVVGPGSVSRETRQEYFQRLGVNMPAENGKYLQEFIAFHSTRTNVEQSVLADEHDQLTSQPWSDQDHPRGREWLQVMGPFLDQIVEGSRRPRMYVPYIGGQDRTQPRMISVLLPSVQDQRMLARSLVIRAYSRIKNEDFDEAWSDLQAVHRQARLISQGFSAIESLVGIALESMACSADAALLQSGKLTAMQLHRYLGDLDKLPALPPMADVVDHGERMMSLDVVQSLARSKGKSLGAIAPSNTSGLERLLTLPIDWNVTLEIFNQEYDRMAEVLRERDPVMRAQKEAEFDAAWKNLTARTRDTVAMVTGALLGSAKTRARHMADVMLTLLLPAFRQMAVAEKRAQARLGTTRVAFAVELFRLEQGQYPDSLSALTPKFVKTLPPDPFTGKPLIFRLDKATGFIVYSLGDNRIDDGGQGNQKTSNPPKGDDLSVTGSAREAESAIPPNGR